MRPIRLAPRRLRKLSHALVAVALLLLCTAPAGHAQSEYSPPGWYQEQLNFIGANNPAADCAPHPHPTFEFFVWVSDCEARGVSYRGKESTFRCSSSHEYAESYSAGPGYDCFAWLGSGNPGWQQRCARGQNDHPEHGHIYPADWFIGTYSVPDGRYVPTATFPSRDACLDTLTGAPPPPDPPAPVDACRLAFATPQKARASGIKLTVIAGSNAPCAAQLAAAQLVIGKKKYLYVGRLPSRTIAAGQSWAMKVDLKNETLAAVKAGLAAGKRVRIEARFTLNGMSATGTTHLKK